MAPPDDKTSSDEEQGNPFTHLLRDPALGHSITGGRAQSGAVRFRMQAEKAPAAGSPAAAVSSNEQERIPFHSGLFPVDLFFKRLKLGKRQGANIIKKGFTRRLLKIATPMIDAEVLPISMPSDRCGPIAKLCIDLLQQGEAQMAEAYSAKLLRADEAVWMSGKVPEQELSELHVFFARLVNGIAWAHNEKCATIAGGFPALHRLHQDVAPHLHRVGQKGLSDRPAWRYLFVATASYDLAYDVAVNALRFFSPGTRYPANAAMSDEQRMERKSNCAAAITAHRLWLASLPSHGADFETYLRQEKIMAIRYWWNLSQLAAVACDIDTFKICFDHMDANCGGGKHDELVTIMNADPDTRAMVALFDN